MIQIKNGREREKKREEDSEIERDRMKERYIE